MRNLLAFLVALALAVPAWAVDHIQTCGAAHEAGTALTGDSLSLKSPGLRAFGSRRSKSLCFDTDGTATSLMFDVQVCDQVDFELFDLTDGDLTGMTAQPYSCGQDTVATTTCNTLGNAMDSTNVRNMGFPANYVFVDVSANSESEDVRVHVRCNIY